MNLPEFVTFYAERNEITKKQAKEEVLSFIDTFKAATYETGNVSLTGFVVATVVNRKGRSYINPRTKEELMSKDKKVVKIKLKPIFQNLADIDDICSE